MPETTDVYHHCPWCGRLNDAATGANGTRPGEGDVSACFGCLRPGIFTATGSVRRPTDQEAAEITSLPDWKALIASLQAGAGPLHAADTVWGSN
jgi:hypothetical protein